MTATAPPAIFLVPPALSSPLLANLDLPTRPALTCQEVAAALGVSDRHVNDLCAEGSLVAFNIGGEGNARAVNFWRIPVSALALWLKGRSSTQPSAARRNGFAGTRSF